jgi:predicted ATPase
VWGANMTGTLSSFFIKALHNSQNVNLSIEDNKIVLVGENGTGKSTVANFIYFFLTRQWRRLLEYDFEAIFSVIDSQEISITKNELTSALSLESHFNHRLNQSQLSRMEYLVRRELREITDLDSDSIDRLNNNDIYHLSNRLNMSPSMIVEYLKTRQLELPMKESKHLDNVENILNTLIKYQILYLPTYRRIERDLRSIFRGLESEIHDIEERQRRRAEHAGYIEFVEFGMQDVEKAISQKMKDIKDNVMSGLSKLTGTYLRDVISGAYQSTELLSSISMLDENTINAIFARIPTEILPDKEQQKLRKIIRDIKRSGTINDKDIVIAHFLSQLINLHKEQQAQEGTVWDFVNVCNKYLQPAKEIIYDNVSFNIYIHKLGQDKESQKISLRDLSSGEKQIVSLFSHIYLSGGSGYFLIIDEPELSLSVPWQKRFLPDILKTNYCKGIVAATHSPFIYENELESYTRSIEDFLEPIVVIPRKTKRS